MHTFSDGLHSIKSISYRIVFPGKMGEIMIGFSIITAGVLAILGFAWLVGLVAEYFGISKG